MRAGRGKMKYHTTFKQLQKHRACKDRYKLLRENLGRKCKLDTPISLLQILESNGLEDALWALIAVDHPDIERDARLYNCNVAEHVLHIYENEHPGDMSLRTCIEVSRRYAHGEATEEELAAAREAARGVAWEAAREAARGAAREAARAAARAAAREAVREAVWAVAREAAWAVAREAVREAAEAAAREAARAVAWRKERKWQEEQYMKYFCEEGKINMPDEGGEVK